jgi:hypothetical protein
VVSTITETEVLVTTTGTTTTTATTATVETTTTTTLPAPTMTGTVTLNGPSGTNGLTIGSYNDHVAYTFRADVLPVNLSFMLAGGQPYLTLTPEKKIFVSRSAGKGLLAYFTDAQAASAGWLPVWCAVEADGLLGCRDRSRPTYTSLYRCGVDIQLGEPGGDAIGSCKLVKFNLPV